jgi:hypothetical protein
MSTSIYTGSELIEKNSFPYIVDDFFLHNGIKEKICTIELYKNKYYMSVTDLSKEIELNEEEFRKIQLSVFTGHAVPQTSSELKMPPVSGQLAKDIEDKFLYLFFRENKAFSRSFLEQFLNRLPATQNRTIMQLVEDSVTDRIDRVTSRLESFLQSKAEEVMTNSSFSKDLEKRANELLKSKMDEFSSGLEKTNKDIKEDKDYISVLKEQTELKASFISEKLEQIERVKTFDKDIDFLYKRAEVFSSELDLSRDVLEDVHKKCFSLKNDITVSMGLEKDRILKETRNEAKEGYKTLYSSIEKRILREYSELERNLVLKLEISLDEAKLILDELNAKYLDLMVRESKKLKKKNASFLQNELTKFREILEDGKKDMDNSLKEEFRRIERSLKKVRKGDIQIVKGCKNEVLDLFKVSVDNVSKDFKESLKLLKRTVKKTEKENMKSINGIQSLMNFKSEEISSILKKKEEDLQKSFSETEERIVEEVSNITTLSLEKDMIKRLEELKDELMSKEFDEYLDESRVMNKTARDWRIEEYGRPEFFEKETKDEEILDSYCGEKDLEENALSKENILSLKENKYGYFISKIEEKDILKFDFDKSYYWDKKKNFFSTKILGKPLTDLYTRARLTGLKTQYDNWLKKSSIKTV